MVLSISEAINVVMENMRQFTEPQNSYPFGFDEIDRYTGGWKRGDLILIVSRPSVGKTSFALNLARNVAVKQGIPTAIFSLLHPTFYIAKRLMSMETGISLGYDKQNIDFAGFENNITDLSLSPIYISEPWMLSIREFEHRISWLVSQKNISFVIIDDPIFIQGPDTYNLLRSKDHMSSLLKSFKEITQKYNVAIVITHHIKHLPGFPYDSRVDHFPMWAITSKALEEYVDMRFCLQYDDDDVFSTGNPYYVKVSVDRNRHGEIWESDMEFEKEKCSFTERKWSIL